MSNLITLLNQTPVNTGQIITLPTVAQMAQDMTSITTCGIMAITHQNGAPVLDDIALIAAMWPSGATMTRFLQHGMPLEVAQKGAALRQAHSEFRNEVSRMWERSVTRLLG